MSYLIFDNDISNNILFDFLKIHCILENNYYIFNKIIYKKYEYSNTVVDFFNSLKPFYKKSKKFYVERESSFTNLLTVIRHICKKYNINYYSKIKYDKNNYFITYYIKNEEIIE
tara:strand:- start:74 stop:415 length:342 start_codon:yes stop_codon:yes gene_type:complete